MRVKSVFLFDLDGTLTDPREGIIRSFLHAFASIGVEAPSLAELEGCIGPPLREAFGRFLAGAEQMEPAIASFRERYGSTGLFENELYPGIVEALARIRSVAARMFVATSKPGLFGARIVDHFGLRSFFDGVYGCEMDGRLADKRELLAHLAVRERLDPVHLVMIGDRKHDILAARANGMRSVGAAWGYGSVEELREAGADVICPSVAELVRHLLGNDDPHARAVRVAVRATTG